MLLIRALRKRWILSACAVTAVFLAATLPILRGDGVPLWDAGTQVSRWFALVGDYARSGEFLLWNPWSNAGSPDGLDPQTGAFSPLTVAFAAFSGGSNLGFVAYWLTTWLLGGLGVLVLARHLRAPRWGGVVASLGFSFCGFYTCAEYTAWLIAFSGLPWIVWRFDVALLERRWVPACEAGALLGLFGLAGYPGVVVGNGLYLVVWGIGRALTGDGSVRAELGRTALALGLTAAVGALVLSPNYLGFTVETAGYSARGHPLPRQAIFTNSLAPGTLATLASPYLQSIAFLNWPKLWEKTYVSVCSSYVGVLVPVFALFSVVARPRDRWRWWLLVCGVCLGFGVAFGDALPLRGWLYDLCPPTRYFRHPALFRAYAIFSLVVLACYGSRQVALRRRKASALLALTAVPLGLLALAAYALVLGSVEFKGDLETLAEQHLLIAWAAPPVLALLLSVGNSRPDRRRWFTAAVVAVACLDALATARLAALTLYDSRPSSLAAWDMKDEVHERGLSLSLNRVNNPAGYTNAHLSPKLAVLLGYSPLNSQAWRRFTKSPAADMALGPDRIWFAPRALQIPRSHSLLDAMIRRADEGAGPMVAIHATAQTGGGGVSGAPDQAEDSSGAPAAHRVPVEVVRYRPAELELLVTCPADGWLLVTDRWAPGWRCWVDGVETQVRPSDLFFRAVPVRAGTRRVRFRYRPWGYPALLILSWGLLAGFGAMAAVRQVRRSGPGGGRSHQRPGGSDVHRNP